ncbi:MAG: TonB-dependent receptor [Bacteroidales bacterium]|nr:TonB-dependent receptor [Bacteroidales bacterium]
MKQLLVILLAIINLALFAQKQEAYTQTIRGTIVDKVTQTALPGASVVVIGSNPIVGTTSNIDGEFRLDALPIGRYSLKISFLGYNPISLRNLPLDAGKELVLNIEMEEQAFTTEEVVIKANNKKDETINKMASVSARSFSVEETEKYAGSLGDPARMASNFAGVAMVNDSRNDIIIRGNSPSGLLWRLDGIEIPNPNHFGAAGTTGGPVSILNNNLLTNSDFFTSAFPAEYGNALSGVFDLKMRSGNNQKREYVGQIGFNGVELGAEGPFSKNSKGSYLINYRYSTLAVMNALGIDMGTGAAIPQYQDLTFKIDLPTAKLGKFSLIGIGGKSYIELYDSRKDPNDLDQGYISGGVDLDYGSNMGVLGLTHQYFFNESTRLNTTIAVQGSQAITGIDSLRFDANGIYIDNSNYRYYGARTTEIKYSASTHLRKKFNSRNNATIGFYYDLYDVSYLDSIKAENSKLFNSNYDVKGQIPILRGYVQWQHQLNNQMSLTGGIYSQYAEICKEASLEPRIGLKYKFKGGKSLGFGYGLHTQTPAGIYYFVQTQIQDGSYAQTNNNMKLSKSHQLVLSYDQLFTENFRIKSEVYYQHLFDIAVSPSSPNYSMINAGADFGGFFPDSLVSDGTGENYGIELTIEKFLSKNFYFLGTVSLYESKYKGYNEVERNSSFNNNYIVNVLGGYEFKIGKRNSIDINLKLVYAGGKPYIPIDLEASKLENTTVYNWDLAYDQKYDDYFSTDIRISFKSNGKKISQEYALDIKNLSNHQNIYSESYNPRTQTISRDYQTGLYPMFLYRIRF